MTFRLFKSFATADECAALREFTGTVRSFLIPNRISPHRYFNFLHALPGELPNVLRDLEYRIWHITDFTAAERDTFLPHYLSVNEPGAAIHPHTDPGVPAGHVNTRFNVMVNKPAGGEPVILGDIVPAETGDAWVFVATTNGHRSNKVIDGWRIVVSYGFQIPLDDARLTKLGIA